MTLRTGPSDTGSAPPLPLEPRVGIRLTVLLFLFCLWFAVIVLRLGQFMIVERGRYTEAMDREAMFEGLVPATRGRILDRDGRVLAWSERLFAVRWRVPRDAAQATQILAVLEQEPWLTQGLPRPLSPACLGTRLILAQDLPVERAVLLEALSDQIPGLEITPTFRRHRVSDPELRRYIGGVYCGLDGTEVGSSGVELEHDDILRGLPGTFRVMLDKEGRWVPETWQKVNELRPGFDVQLPVRTGHGGGRLP